MVNGACILEFWTMGLQYEDKYEFEAQTYFASFICDDFAFG